MTGSESLMISSSQFKYSQHGLHSSMTPVTLKHCEPLHTDPNLKNPSKRGAEFSQKWKSDVRKENIDPIDCGFSRFELLRVRLGEGGLRSSDSKDLF